MEFTVNILCEVICWKNDTSLCMKLLLIMFNTECEKMCPNFFFIVWKLGSQSNYVGENAEKIMLHCAGNSANYSK